MCSTCPDDEREAKLQSNLYTSYKRARLTFFERPGVDVDIVFGGVGEKGVLVVAADAALRVALVDERVGLRGQTEARNSRR